MALRGAAWGSVARRIVQVSTLRTYARCHILRWYGVTLLPPDDRGSNPATATQETPIAT